MMTEIFHLSLPVSNLQTTRQFYEKYLSAKTGRVTDTWLDLWLFGAQITIQQVSDFQKPEQIEKLHLGGTLSWEEWHATRTNLETLGAPFADAPMVDEALGQAKLYLTDPDGYVIELKAYKDIAQTLRPPV